MQWAILLLFVAAVLGQVAPVPHHTTVLIDVAAPNSVRRADRMRRVLTRAYESRLLPHAGNKDTISIYTFTQHADEVLTWTSVWEKDLIHQAIGSIDFDTSASACSNWEAALKHMHKEPLNPRPTRIVFIVDKNPTCAGQTHYSTHMMARFLHGRHIKVFPIGLTPHVRDEWLKEIAGPCGRWGCVPMTDFIHYNSYHAREQVQERAVVPQERAVLNCLDDISPLNVNCVANDISSTVVITQLVGPPVCARGFEIQVGLELTITTTATTRYDVGVWIAQDGGDALTGCCNAFALQPVSLTNLDLDVVGGLGPYKNEELAEPADTCGDMSSAENGGSIVTRLGDALVPVLCADSDMPADNALDANLCLSYGNNARTGTPCTTGLDTIPSQSSKCNCQQIDFFTIVVGDPPLAVDDMFGTVANGTICHSVLDNDFEGDPNGASFNISTLEICGGPDPDIGTLEVVGDQICFTPDEVVSAGNATFCYTICNEWYDGNQSRILFQCLDRVHHKFQVSKC